ncbi:hypothetical protein V2J09_005089 [Rumex salicifolius]
MAKLRLSFTLLHHILFIPFVLPLAAAGQTIWVHQCDSVNGNYTTNGTYSNNLNSVLTKMTSTDINFGFYNLSAGDNSGDVAYLISLCMGNLPVSDCHACQNYIKSQINSLCPNQETAIYWSDDCMVRYSSNPILATVEKSPNFVMLRNFTIDSSETTKYYNNVVGSLVKSLPGNASKGNSSLKFATAQAGFDLSITIYSAAQCIPELAQNDCLHNHMCGDLALFSNLKQGFKRTVKLGNHTKMQVVGKGNVRMAIGGVNHLVQDVLYVPDLKNNLLSIGQLQERGLAILIKEGQCKVYHPTKGLIIQSTMTSNRMFTLISDQIQGKEEAPVACFQAKVEDVARLWHSRYGHLSYIGLKILKDKNMVKGLPSFDDTKLVCVEYEENKFYLSYDGDSTDNTIIGKESSNRKIKIIAASVAGGLVVLLVVMVCFIFLRKRKLHWSILSNRLMDKDDISNIESLQFNFSIIRAATGNFSEANKVGEGGFDAVYKCYSAEVSNKAELWHSRYGHLSFKGLQTLQEKAMVDGLPEFGAIKSTCEACIWRKWSEGVPLDVIDSSILDGSESQILRCIHIGLLCVQDNMVDRPTMSSVVLMMSSESLALPLPSHPAYINTSNMPLNTEDANWLNDKSTDFELITELQVRYIYFLKK